MGGAPGSRDPGRQGDRACPRPAASGRARGRPCAAAATSTQSGGKINRSPARPWPARSRCAAGTRERRLRREARAGRAASPGRAAARAAATFRPRGGPASSPDFLPGARRGRASACRSRSGTGWAGAARGYAARSPRGAAGVRGAGRPARRRRSGPGTPSCRRLSGLSPAPCTGVRGRECAANFAAGGAASGRPAPSEKPREGGCGTQSGSHFLRPRVRWECVISSRGRNQGELEVGLGISPWTSPSVSAAGVRAAVSI